MVASIEQDVSFFQFLVPLKLDLQLKSASTCRLYNCVLQLIKVFKNRHFSLSLQHTHGVLFVSLPADLSLPFLIIG